MVTTLRLHECFFLQSLVIDNFLRAVNEENQVWAPKFKYYFNELRETPVSSVPYVIMLIM